MPKAVVDVATTRKYELKTCPGGYVELRRLTYGQKLERQAMAMQASLRGEGKKAEMNMTMMQQEAAAFEYRHCVVSHNLEDENGKPLNFSSPADVFRLDPRVGEEIATLIEALNDFEGSEQAENSEAGSEPQ